MKKVFEDFAKGREHLLAAWAAQTLFEKYLAAPAPSCGQLQVAVCQVVCFTKPVDCKKQMADEYEFSVAWAEHEFDDANIERVMLQKSVPYVEG